MSDRDALLAAIRANPEDDTPRLVFADWLDEHEPDTGRRSKKATAAAPSSWAALIRTECALARLEDEDAPATALLRFFTDKDSQSLDGVRWNRAEPGLARLLELQKRGTEFRRAASKALGKSPSGEAGVTAAGTGTRRGFRERFQVTDTDKFAAHLPELLERYPRASVVMYHPVPNPDELVLEGFARWCREVRFHTDFAEHAELVRALSAAPETSGVRALVLNTSDPSAAGRALDALAGSPHWSGLRELDLAVTLGPRAADALNDAFERLLRAPHLRGLRKLRLAHCGNLTAFLPLIAALPELRELDLTGCGVGDAGAAVLANTPALKNLRFLDLESNGITGAGASALIASPHLTGLTVLHLNQNPVRNLDRAALAGAPAGGLRLIGFHGARLTVRDVGALASSPRLSELVYFDADDNNLPDAAFVRLVQGFGDRAPAILYLTGNDIGEAGIEALTTWPAAADVDMLHLTRNTLTTPAAKALAACPHLRQLSHLCANCAHPAGRKALKARFGARAVV